MNIFLQTIQAIFSSYTLTDAVPLSCSYVYLLIRNRLALRNPNKERFMGFEFEFPFRPAFFGLIHEIFFKPFVYIKKDIRPVTVFDCGTNIGVRMMYLKWRYPNATFVCFEPNEVVLPYLRKNILLNGMSNSVTLHPYALGKEEGSIEFFYNTNVRASGSASVVKPEIMGDTQVSREVPQKRLSNYILAPVEFLKLDIEGAEGAVIEDLRDTNTLSHISKILIEYHFDGVTMTYPLEKIVSILSESGFVCTHSPLEVFRPDSKTAVLHTCMIYGERKF